jgi:act minimal PKS acyl carrier protein
MPTFTADDLRRILTDRIGLAEADIPEDLDTPFADLGLDSLAVVEIQLAVQQRYGFGIPDADAGVMTTMAEAIDYVNRRLAAVEVV